MEDMVILHCWSYQYLIDSNNRGAAWRLIGLQTFSFELNECAAYGDVNPLDYNAWEDNQSNRNRAFKTLHDNNFGNNFFFSGDLVSLLSHLSNMTVADRFLARIVGI